MDLKDLVKLSKQIEEERVFIRKILKWEIDPSQIKWKNLLKTVLMIVESPNKARTIANFFWKPSRRILKKLNVYEVSIWDKLFLISSSWWHIVDLITKKWIYGVDIENDKFFPNYDSIKRCQYKFNHEEEIQIIDEYEKCIKITLDKIDFITSLQKLSLEVDEIYIATDPDTEGEKISYDLYCLLKPYNINIFRIEYHEVTKQAILKAIEEKRQVNIDLVRAQIVRRVSDRWVWFSLSEKLQEYFKNPNYSAWRVQTPVLGWIIKRDEQWKDKKALIKITFNDLNLEFKEGYYIKNFISFEEEDIEKVKNIKKLKQIEIKTLNTEKEEVNPLPPYSTDALLQDANDRLKFGADKTMQLAQDLFEAWLITYHRTDSIHISNVGINIAVTYLKEKNLDQYFYPRHWWKEGTHEAIRPTKSVDTEELKQLYASWMITASLTSDHFKLYDLIFKRFIASQMKPYIIENKDIKIIFSEINFEKNIQIPYQLIQNWWNLIKPVWILPLKDWIYTVDIDKKLIPKVLPYTQWTLINEMKEKGLWRPSTYATIVTTLLKRWYVIQIPKTWWLKSTKKWKEVYQYLINNYSDLVSEQFTAFLEKQMDEVELWKDHFKILAQLLEKLKKYNLIKNS